MDLVRKILAETFRLSIQEITDYTNIGQVDTWDSLTHMEMVANLEAALGVEFDGDEIAEMTDVVTVETIIRKKL